MAETTATDIIDSVTDYAMRFVADLWEREGHQGTADQFEADVLRVFTVKLDNHLATLDAREPGKAALVRELFTAEYEASN